MSRSHKAAYCTDNNNSHDGKKRAARVHRHGENTKLSMHQDAFIEQPSMHYTNPYDICDFSFPAGDDGWRVKNQDKIRK